GVGGEEGGGGGGGVRVEGGGRGHPRRRRMERDVEFHGLDQPIGRAIVFESDRAGVFGAHRRSTCGKGRFYTCIVERLPALMALQEVATHCFGGTRCPACGRSFSPLRRSPPQSPAHRRRAIPARGSPSAFRFPP